MNTQINCKNCNGLRRAEVLANVILDTCITSEIRCAICNTVHVVQYTITNFVRKYTRKIERPLLDDEQVEYGSIVGHNEH